MKRNLWRREAILAAGLCLMIAAGLLSGCGAVGIEKDSGENVRDLEFTVIGDQDVQQELQELINEKKAEAFKLTYTNDQGLYIVNGYGQQQSGGYSIAVKE